MTQREESDNNVEPRAVINDHVFTLDIRRSDNDEGEPGLWIKPDHLDQDGEFYLRVADIKPALAILGINRVDVWPG